MYKWKRKSVASVDKLLIVCIIWINKEIKQHEKKNDTY